MPIGPKNIYTPRKNIGHYKAPGGTYTSKQETILKKATKVTDGIITSGAKRAETTLFYETVYHPTVEYTISQYFLTEKQLDHTELKILL